MRKHRWLAVILAMTMLLGMMPAIVAADAHETGCQILYAGQNTRVGTVCVENDEDEICVTYKLDADKIAEGWVFTELHLAIAEDFAGLPKNGTGNPVPGAFQHKEYFAMADEKTEWTFKMYLADIGEDGVEAGAKVFIAAHAVVEKCTVVDTGEKGFVSEVGVPVYGPIYDAPDEFTVWDDSVPAVEAVNNISNVNFQWGSGNPGNPANIAGVIWISTAPHTELWTVDSWRKVEIDFTVGQNASGEIVVNSDNENWVYLNGVQIGTDALIFNGPKTYTITPDPGDHKLVFIWKNWAQSGAQVNNPNGLTYKVDIAYDPVTVCEKETAWADGTRFVNRGNWATYFCYVIEQPVATTFHYHWGPGVPYGATAETFAVAIVDADGMEVWWLQGTQWKYDVYAIVDTVGYTPYVADNLNEYVNTLFETHFPAVATVWYLRVNIGVSEVPAPSGTSTLLP